MRVFGNGYIINESRFLNQKDIYYNKNKFDNGEINICFICGFCGSGKSTMASNMESKDIEKYELDDVSMMYKFSDDELKEYGDLIYSYFKTVGKKFRYYTLDDMINNPNPGDNYGDKFGDVLINEFVDYSIKYAKSHKNKKFIIEGVWLYLYVNPEKLKDYAVYIKGTSALISAFRAAKRDANSDDVSGLKKIKTILRNFRYGFKNSIELHESKIQKYIDYFKDKKET